MSRRKERLQAAARQFVTNSLAECRATPRIARKKAPLDLTGKWGDAAPDDPWPKVAQRLLAIRLHSVRRAIRPAAREPEDTENVHRLRVASRRAPAALALCADWLKPSRYARMKAHIKRIRQAAGDARDLDVLAARWQGDSAYRDWIEAVDLSRQFSKLRRQAQEPLRALDRGKSGRRMSESIAKLTQGLRPRATGADEVLTVRDMARRSMRAEVDAYFAISDPGECLESLHALRIAGKRLRYTMELMACGFSSDFRGELYPRVEELQELLGEVNDRSTGIARLCLWQSTASPKRQIDFQMLINLETEGMERARARFRKHWTAARRRALQAEFESYLGRPRTDVITA